LELPDDLVNQIRNHVVNGADVAMKDVKLSPFYFKLPDGLVNQTRNPGAYVKEFELRASEPQCLADHISEDHPLEFVLSDIKFPKDRLRSFRYTPQILEKALLTRFQVEARVLYTEKSVLFAKSTQN
jgi:hypothetical protein